MGPISAVGGTLSKAKVEPDRRTGRRYPIDQVVHYKLLCGGNICKLGEGRAVDMSSTGISFTVKNELPHGIGVELTVEWPVLLHGTTRIKLMLFGIVARSDEHSASMKILRHEFRTQGVGSQRIDRPQPLDMVSTY